MHIDQIEQQACVIQWMINEQNKRNQRYDKSCIEEQHQTIKNAENQNWEFGRVDN